MNQKTESKKNHTRIILAVCIIAAACAFFILDLHHYFSFEYIKGKQDVFRAYYSENAPAAIAVYMGVYIAITALSLPGATVMTLAGGALFGFWTGLAAVSFASTIGATLAFLISRFLLRNWVRDKLGDRLNTIDAGIEKDGYFYLLSLRLVPLFPFFLINLAMGLTPIRTGGFYIVSQLGMLPGAMVYINAGTQLAKIDSPKGIMSPELLLSFALLGIFPLVTKKAVETLKKRRTRSGA